MRYWLLKSEPSCYSIDDFKRDKVTSWTDVRNYQARNFLCEMEVGDGVLFYHSSCDAVGVVGVGKVSKTAYPDKTQFDVNCEGFDPRATLEKPRWFAVDVQFVEKCKTPFLLSAIKADKQLTGIEVARQGSRLSVQPVREDHFMHILKQGSAQS